MIPHGRFYGRTPTLTIGSSLPLVRILPKKIKFSTAPSLAHVCLHRTARSCAVAPTELPACARLSLGTFKPKTENRTEPNQNRTE
jgi:hypothetical protein